MKNSTLDHNAIRKRIMAIRATKKMTQEKFADYTQICLKTISSIESEDRNAGLESVCKIAKAFNVSLDFLVLGRCYKKSMKKFSELYLLIADCNESEVRMICETVALLKTHLRANRSTQIPH